MLVNSTYILARPREDALVITYVVYFLVRLLQLTLFILGIRTITILMKKLAKFSIFEKQLLSLLILKCVYTLLMIIIVS